MNWVSSDSNELMLLPPQQSPLVMRGGIWGVPDQSGQNLSVAVKNAEAARCKKEFRLTGTKHRTFSMYL